jgi:hypothetical protein
MHSTLLLTLTFTLFSLSLASPVPVDGRFARSSSPTTAHTIAAIEARQYDKIGCATNSHGIYNCDLGRRSNAADAA